jgi:hypothetical protein
MPRWLYLTAFGVGLTVLFVFVVVLFNHPH